jgi:hypothetical protein
MDALEEKRMSILPEGEQLRRAIRWISDMRLDNPAASPFRLIEEACLKFDLPPKDGEFLMHFFADKVRGKTD